MWFFRFIQRRPIQDIDIEYILYQPTWAKETTDLIFRLLEEGRWSK